MPQAYSQLFDVPSITRMGSFEKFAGFKYFLDLRCMSQVFQLTCCRLSQALV